MSEEWFDSAKLESCRECRGEGKVRARDPFEVREEREAYKRKVARRAAFLISVGGVTTAVIQQVSLSVMVGCGFGYERAVSVLFLTLILFAVMVFCLYHWAQG